MGQHQPPLRQRAAGVPDDASAAGTRGAQNGRRDRGETPSAWPEVVGRDVGCAHIPLMKFKFKM